MGSRGAGGRGPGLAGRVGGGPPAARPPPPTSAASTPRALTGSRRPSPGCGRLGRPRGRPPRPRRRLAASAPLAAGAVALLPPRPVRQKLPPPRAGPGPPPLFLSSASPPLSRPSPARLKGGAAARDAASVLGAGPRAPEEETRRKPRRCGREGDGGWKARGQRPCRTDGRPDGRTAASEPACAAGRLRLGAAATGRAGAGRGRRTRDNTRAVRLWGRRPSAAQARPSSESSPPWAARGPAASGRAPSPPSPSEARRPGVPGSRGTELDPAFHPGRK